jgi:hypothetical protein
MVAIPTIEEEDARRPNRERQNLVTEQIIAQCRRLMFSRQVFAVASTALTTSITVPARYSTTAATRSRLFTSKGCTPPASLK